MKSSTKASGNGQIEISLEPETLARSVLARGWLIILAIAVGDIALNHFGGLPSPIKRSFNIAKEDSIGTWFSVVQLLATSIVAWAIYKFTKRNGEPASTTLPWAFLAGYLLYMSLDDAAVIHERMGSTFADSVGFFPSNAWQIIYAPIFFAFGLLLLYTAWRLLDSPVSRLSIVLGLALLALAVALDFTEGIEGLHRDFAEAVGLAEQTVSHFQKVIEEAAEMAGITLFLSAFVRQYASIVSSVSAQFDHSAD